MKTEDGWHLTMFRITGRNGEKPAKDEANKDKFPVLIQHGYTSSASNWVGAGVGGPSMPLRLVEEGYDVWMGNNRGVPYSNKHDRDGEWSLWERWNFSFAEMGIYDMPA